MPEAMRTFQCRVEAPVALDAMADLLGRLERRLYAEIAAGAVDMNAVKRDFIASQMALWKRVIQQHGIKAE